MIGTLSLPAAGRVLTSRVLAIGTVGLLAAGVLAGCSADPPPPSPPVPTFSATSSAGATSTSSRPRLPAECSGLISTQNLDLALRNPLVGRVRGIVGIPEPKINRLERVTCQYGLPEAPPPGQPAPVPLEISVSRYADEASATERVNDTIESERARGAAPSAVPVGPASGTVLISADRRLLVAASGAITVAITLAPGLADDRAAEVLSDIGGQVLTAVT